MPGGGPGGGGGVPSGGSQRPLRWGAVRAGEGRMQRVCHGPCGGSPAGSPRPSPRPGAPPPPPRAVSSRRGAAIPMGTACPLRSPEYFQPSSLPADLASPRRFASHLHAPYVRQDLMESGMGGCQRRHTYIHTYTCIHTTSLRSRSWEDADTFYPGTRSTRRRTRNGRRERRPCWTGIRLPRTRLATAPPARAPVGPSVRPSSLSLRARRDGLAQAAPQRRSGAEQSGSARRPHGFLTGLPAPGLQPAVAEIPRPCFSAASRERPGKQAERSHSLSKRWCSPLAFLSSSVPTPERGLLILALASP